jgi:hypothetical protein
VQARTAALRITYTALRKCSQVLCCVDSEMTMRNDQASLGFHVPRLAISWDQGV